jgi:hypothetical protein
MRNQRSHLSPFRRYACLGLLAGMALASASCGDHMAAPTGPPRAALVGWLIQNSGLLGCAPLPYDSVTQTVGPAGGTIDVGPHVLSIPAGALGDTVTITAVAPSDTVRRVQFRPEGLTFATAASLRLSYAGCNLLGSVLPKQIAYTDDALNILEYLLSVDDLPTQTVTGKLHHFSSYAVAW